ncbi:unnamed protein product [Arctia plantaginis]|uniref:ABC transporter domain-containing protein n=1 Tax=Arctia plantaginis TaxID=874455 RepID=A0A8S1ANV6_ARCPL|nr:unnamed protein product [Arctia plantaginis]CAB3247952.1 unnamed protein product [Arctia plantaginis]
MASENSDSHETNSTLLVEDTLTISFQNISYNVATSCWTNINPRARKTRKTILNDVSGTFNAGELSVIMGPSGAGKSTLMDILAGYTKPSDGYIYINGRIRNEKKFRRRSCYILQDDKVQDMLTIRESLNFAADLKLGNHISQEQKKQRINEIIESLGLRAVIDVKSVNLSGGQRKRLAIGLELISDPQIMFLDEPTSGLDSSISKQIVYILHFLARQGRTVVVTMHQPSATLLRMVDRLYAVVGGQCAYVGAETQLRPCLEEMNLKCPAFHNPVDFLIEISAENSDMLIRESENGRNTRWMSNTLRDSDNNITVEYKPGEEVSLTMLPAPKEDFTRKTLLAIKSTYSTSFWKQFTILTRRSLWTIWRDPWFALTFASIHCGMALLVGTLYYKIGNDGFYALDTVKFLQFCLLFLMFTSFSAISIRFPQEIPVIRREHFNRWYSAGAYYMSTIISVVPLQTICTLLFAFITYFLTTQPVDFVRICNFCFILLMVSYVSLCKGLLIGAIFNVKNGVIMGPFFIMPFVMFSGNFIKTQDVPALFNWILQISFLKHGFVGLLLSVFGSERPNLNCEDHIYCHFKVPKTILKEYGALKEDYVSLVIALFGIGSTVAIIAFIILKIRLRNKW